MTTATTGYNPYQPMLEEAQPPPKYGATAETGATVTKTPPRPNYIYVHTIDEDREVNSNLVLVYSGLIAVFCGICSPITLVCSIPAIVFASMSSQGEYEQRQKNCRISGIFATIALISGLVLTTIATAILFYYRSHMAQSQQH